MRFSTNFFNRDFHFWDAVVTHVFTNVVKNVATNVIVVVDVAAVDQAAGRLRSEVGLDLRQSRHSSRIDFERKLVSVEMRK